MGLIRIAIYLKRIPIISGGVGTIEKRLLTYICQHQVVPLQNKCELSRPQRSFYHHRSGKN